MNCDTMMAGDHLTDFYRGISMKIKLFLAVILLLTVALLPYCVWQSNIDDTGRS
jgi:hypothetical protein